MAEVFDRRGDQLAAEAKTGQQPSLELTRAVSQAMSDLQAFKIPHPNWHNLSVWPILAWLPYVDMLSTNSSDLALSSTSVRLARLKAIAAAMQHG